MEIWNNNQTIEDHPLIYANKKKLSAEDELKKYRKE
jgi:hypothetical protein